MKTNLKQKKQPGPMKNQNETMKNHENQPGTIKNHENWPGTMKTNLEPWKPTWNNEKPTWNHE